MLSPVIPEAKPAVRTMLDYQLAQRWFTGARLDRADRFGSGHADQGLSATLTFWPSEFSQLRGQLRRTKYGDSPELTHATPLESTCTSCA